MGMHLIFAASLQIERIGIMAENVHQLMTIRELLVKFLKHDGEFRKMVKLKPFNIKLHCFEVNHLLPAYHL